MLAFCCWLTLSLGTAALMLPDLQPSTASMMCTRSVALFSSSTTPIWARPLRSLSLRLQVRASACRRGAGAQGFLGAAPCSTHSPASSFLVPIGTGVGAWELVSCHFSVPRSAVFYLTEARAHYPLRWSEDGHLESFLSPSPVLPVLRTDTDP